MSRRRNSLSLATSLWIATWVASISLAASISMADDFKAPDGCYVGLSGNTQLTDNDFSGPNEVETDVSNSYGVSARVGCITENGWLGIDLHGEWVSGWKVDTPGKDYTVGGGTVSTGLRIYLMRVLTEGMDVSVSGQLRRFQPYIYGSMGYVSLDTPDYSNDDDDFMGRVGGGVEFFVTDHVALALDAGYILPASKDLSNFDYLSIGWGAIYHF